MELKPPKFCKNAIATNRGWVDALSGKLLAPCNGLLNRINQLREQEKKNEPAIRPLPEIEIAGDIVLTDEVVADCEQHPEVIELKPVKKNKRKKQKSGEDNG